MSSITSKKEPADAKARAFPRTRVLEMLREELTELEDNARLLKGDWEPSIDSLQLVEVVLKIEKLIGCRLRPEDIIRRGGYGSVDAGLDDMTSKIEARWRERMGR